MKLTKTALWTSAGLIGLAFLVVKPAAADQVFLDDIIVDGSACIGLDCVNGESFGFDTLRLKENNLRIKAQDTSSTASFPTNDWQITFNDSSNGGANKFSIDDINGGRTPFTIEAGAPSHSLYVDDGGRLGFGTSTPVVELHVKDGDTPTLRLEQDGSSGFTPQTWDVAGNETNFFVRDATNGSKLPFRIRPAAPTNSIYIDTNGEMGFGNSDPDSSLHVTRSSDNASLRLEQSTVGSEWVFSTLASNGNLTINKVGSGGQEITIRTQNGIGAGSATLEVAGEVIATNVVTASSRELKTDFATIDARETLRQLAGLPVTEWRFKQNPADHRHVGPVAEDFHAVFGLGDGRSVSVSDANGITMAAIQGLYSILQDREKEIEILGKENAGLLERVAALESRMEPTSD